MARFLKPYLEDMLGALGGGRAETGSVTSVSGSATSTTLLAANASRRGATIHNDSAADLYIKLASGAASTTSFTDKLAQGDYYEVPYHYTGIIVGIWGSATGAARITEFS